MSRRMRRMLHNTVHIVGNPRHDGRQTGVCAMYSVDSGLRLQNIQLAGASSSLRLPASSSEMCGNCREDAISHLTELEQLTAPGK